MYNDVTGIILAGGKSSRMGSNKALLEVNGRPFIENTVSLLCSLFKNVSLVTNNAPEYEFLNIEAYEDIYPNKGPLAGIHSGLFYSKTERNFVISCDLPLMNAEMISFITDFRTEKPVTVVKAEGFIQQLCGIYNKNCLSKAEELLNRRDSNSATGKYKCMILTLIEYTGAEIIDAETIPGYKEGMFLNMNTREDYLTALSKYKDVTL